jgi:hypothetical protein
VAGLGSAAVHPCDDGRIRTAVRREGRIQRSDTWSGEGSRSVSQSGGKEGHPLTATADFRRSSASP